MTTRDTTERYGSVSRLLHWATALLIIHQFGKFFDRIDEGEHWLGALVGPLHVSIGALIGLLALVRIGWAVSQAERPPAQGALAALASIGHKTLYACMLLLPVTGTLYVLGHGYPLGVFGVQLVAKTGVETPWMISAGSWHSPLAWLTLLLVLGHIGAALYHHVVLKDGTLARMR